MPQSKRLIEPVAVLDPDGSGNFQTVFPGNSGEWFLARDEDGDMWFDRHAGSGLRMRDRCILKNAGHVTMSGYDSGFIYSSHDGHIVRFPYLPGEEVYGIDVEVLPFTGQISLSPTRRYCVTRSRNSKWSYFTRRRLDDVVRGIDLPLGRRITVPRSGTRVEQSFGVCDNSLILGYGAANAHNWVEQWEFVTGHAVRDDIDVTTHGLDAVVPSERGWHEIEGAPGNLVMSKAGTGAGRRIAIGRLTIETKITLPVEF
jgi:hypothetical protein